MTWLNSVDKVFLINLPHRTDRLEKETAILNDYEIPFEVYVAEQNEKGYFGLLVTMKKLFSECLENNHNTVLVFEDDFKPLEGKETFHDTMDKCMEDLESINWDIFYLGIQHPMKFRRWVTKNILPVNMGYSTHAVMYKRRAMQFFVEKYFDEPIDNFLVREFQPMNTCYCSYPLLASQFEGMSDIGGQKIDWGRYIENSYEKAIRDLKSR